MPLMPLLTKRVICRIFLFHEASQILFWKQLSFGCANVRIIWNLFIKRPKTVV